ncbi:MarR family transcriptional regulator [Paenibacillus sp. 1011MAR3C5]|uniref:MarR family winged helix-turn-helix transcriptional regulator n=1 Tax=Paenibacillus sp. 1011MAR3C5 TaxID=1675787 RepID=UPI000E6BD661|nr:MarR family transcriptional regulator [Paenibacillus sp. 1011MAR3C5]RJE89728.1 MarR family transcriptional regulator [Paenibacillus sp. 1011MAR3C5]
MEHKEVKEQKQEQELPIGSVGFLMGVTYRKLTALLQQRLKEYEVTPEQWSVLYTIVRSQGLIQKEIADRTHKDKPATTRILDHLESKGLIYKQVGKQDRRSFLVYSTDKGRTVIEQTIPIEAGMTDVIKSVVSEAELAQLMNVLLRIQAHASQMLDQESRE